MDGATPLQNRRPVPRRRKVTRWLLLIGMIALIQSIFWIVSGQRPQPVPFLLLFGVGVLGCLAVVISPFARPLAPGSGHVPFDERERDQILLVRARTYRLAGIMLAVSLIAAGALGGPGWVPHSTKDWLWLLVLLAILWPILPVVVAEWTIPFPDPEMALDDVAPATAQPSLGEWFRAKLPSALRLALFVAAVVVARRIAAGADLRSLTSDGLLTAGFFLVFKYAADFLIERRLT